MYSFYKNPPHSDCSFLADNLRGIFVFRFLFHSNQLIGASA
ncbi:hypothetical protein EVA_19757 [gut metagenome]|uniref:Uncharacterized protein n=1 Tax=gut metagenome TaxID=749906 RepID=J9FB63_9ZZZZ